MNQHQTMPQTQEGKASLQTLERMIAEVKDYAIIMLNPAGEVMSWNSGAETIKGYAEHEILGQSFKRFYSDEDLKNGKPDKLLQEARVKNRAYDEGWRLRKDGSRFWGGVTITAIHDDNGEVTGYGKVTRDLTEKKQAEENLQKLHRAIDEIEDYAIILLDLDGNILNWNKGAQNIKGYKAKEIIGKNFRQFYTLEDLDNKKPDKLLEVAREKGRADDEGWRVCKGGDVFWASVSITAIHDDNREVKGYSKVTRDLTERKLAAEKLQQHSKELEVKNHELNQFAYIASHDLQEPLNTVKSVLSILRDNYEDTFDETGKDLLNYIAESTVRMGDLIKGLLDFGRLGQHGKQEEVALNKLVDEVQADLKNRIEKTNATIKVGKLPTINAFKVEVRLLLQNLISNGIKFHRKDTPPVIEVRAEAKNNQWVFCIKDNGIGIPEKYMDKLFMIFKRLPTEAEYEGTGIGLAHCKKVVTLHKGDIWVESVENQGSSFYFTLPLNNQIDEA
jgi:PAS domain S-box-containing protein